MLEMAQTGMNESGSVVGESGFAALARQHYDGVYRFLLNQAPDPQDAADLTQETFLRALKGFKRFDPNREFAPWIFKIARHVVADFYRSRREGTSLENVGFEDPQPGPREQTDSTEARVRIWQLARSLKPKHHQVLLLFYKENLSIEETARAMGITGVHVKVLLHRARSLLKALLADEPNLQEIVYENLDR